MTLRERQSRFWVMVARLIACAEASGTPIVVLEWMRSKETQAIMVARGSSKTMNSNHLLGLAVDVCFIDDLMDDSVINYSREKYKLLGEFWETMGGRWGGRFGDNPATPQIEGWDCGHFELAGPTIRR